MTGAVPRPACSCRAFCSRAMFRISSCFSLCFSRCYVKNGDQLDEPLQCNALIELMFISMTIGMWKFASQCLIVKTLRIFWRSNNGILLPKLFSPTVRENCARVGFLYPAF